MFGPGNAGQLGLDESMIGPLHQAWAGILDALEEVDP
jgi:hypothetical protein